MPGPDEATGVLEGVMLTQSEIMGAMEKLLVNFKKDSSARKNPSNIKRRLETLDAYWQDFQDNHFRLDDEVKNKASHSYFTENYYQQTEKFYKETRSYIEKFITLSDTTVQEQTTTSKGSESTSTSTPGVKQDTAQRPMEEAHEISQETILIRNLLRKQEANFMAFKRTLSMIEVEKTIENWELEDSLKSLQMRWSEVDKLHWEIMCETGEENSEYEGKFGYYEKKYLNTKRAINTKLWSMKHREKATPQLDIPIFGGNYNQWVPFKNLFLEAIHDNPSISNAQKMQFLRSKVRGDAERLIQHLQISSENYITCWDILNNRFNNKKLIFTSHINTLLSLPNMQQQSAGQIKKLHDVTVETLNAIKNLDVSITTWDPLLIHLLTQKLDSETHSDYIESLKNPRELPILSEFLEFLEGKFTALESSRRKQENIQHKSNPFFNRENPTTSKWASNNQGKNNIQHKNIKTFTKSFHASSNFKCPLCSRDHGIYNCKSFLEMPSDQKLKTVNKLKLCTNCLFSHNGSSCTSTKMCRKCAKQHSTILHDAYAQIQPTQLSASRSSNANNRNENITTNSHISQNNHSEILLATAVLEVKSIDGTYLKMRVLIDQGSQISIITEKASQQLGIKRQKCQGTIFGVGEKENSCKGLSNIECRSMYNDFTFNAEVLIMNNLIKSLPNKTFEKPSWNHIANINLADPEFNKSRPVDLLLGADIYSIIILSGMIKGEETSQPIAQQTQLGWLLCGNARTYHCNVIINNLDEIKRFWDIEEISEQSNLSLEDQKCLDFFTKTTLRKEDGRYEVRLPMKDNFEQKLGSSKNTAIAQFRNLEKKFNIQPQLANEYKSFMSEYLALGHMKLDTTNNSTIECYLPHHGVQRNESTTTKYRVVFNASANTSSGNSLNDLMYAGPNLQHDLQALLLKWRQFKYAFTADIEKMFRQILLSEKDQHLQKIIWRETQSQPLETYNLTTVSYGNKAAPFLAMMTLRRLASDERDVYPEASKVLESAFYMDDLLFGSHSIENGRKLIADLNALLKSGGMNLRKWSSNNNELLSNIKQECDNDNNSIFTFKTDNNTKTLGLTWNSVTDKFTFQFNISNNDSKLTKRSLLSQISKLFDPLGWLAPLSTKLKLLFQKVWKTDKRWDDVVPENISKEWLKIKSDIELINTFEIPRWLLCNADDVIILHGFCDASEEAYACVVYAQIKGRPETTLVAAKSKLVPFKKAYSLPKLELSGAVLMAKLTAKIKKSFDQHAVEVQGWTDSMVTLGWIQGEPDRWKPFVANRVQQIKETLPKNCWRYVKSSDNPADAASRGLYVSQLKEHLLWWKGPQWLSTYNIQQTELPKYDTDLELRSKFSKQTNIVQTGDNENIIDSLLQKHNSITFITRIIAWILRALNPQRKQLPKHITLQEINKASLIIVKYVQATECRADIDSIQKHGVVKNNSKLLNLYPIICKDNILRVGGRLKHSSLSFENKHPAIIPAHHKLATLLINKAHLDTFHGGPTLTLARLRKQYWITGGVNIVKKQVRKCVTCRKQESRPQHQVMGDLPVARTNPAPPYYHTGLDYSGFLEIKLNKSRSARTTKGYVAVFICMVTKAIHLEIVSELTSSAFLAALRRMAARRGAPAHIYSDNGTNFHGAHNILKQEYQQIQQTFNDSFLKEVTDMNIEWHFTAPSWPSSGGLWERAVRSMKHHLKRVVGQQKLTFEEFSTILAQLEACLNSRPLCALTEDIDDLNVLTPAHFLTGRADVTIIETAEDARTRWHLTSKIFQEIWKRWKDEYLSQLTARKKWLQPQQNIKIGDIVVIQDDNLPAGKWAIGRVSETHPGPDGYVRVVTLKTRNGYIKRPVVKLSVLPIESTQHETEQNQDKEQPPKQNKTPTKTKSTLSTIVMTLIYLLTLFTNTFGASVITELNNNQTLYFDPIANIQLSRNTWNLVVYYDMNPYWEGNEAYEKIQNYLITTCDLLSSDNQCNMIVPQLHHQYAELQYYNQLLLNQHFNAHSRQRRGFINGVGYLANSLFGVLDERFAEQYSKDIEALRQNEAHINNLWKNQTSLIESEYNLLKRTEEAMAKQHKIINKHLNNAEKRITVLEKEINRVSLTEDFTLSVITAQQMLQTLKDIQQTLLDTLTDIYQGHFNIHLLTPKQLITELNTISGLLSADVTVPIHNIQSDVRDIYKLLKIKARMTESYFIFEIKIPLVSRDTYDLYKIISIPQRIGRYMRNIIPTSDQIAISLQKDTYIPVSQDDLQNCVSKDLSTLICSLKSPIYKLKNDQDLCIRNENKLDQCKTNIVACQSQWHALAKLNTYLFICCGQCQVRTICKDQVTAHQVTSPSIISIGGDCLLKTDNFTVLAHTNHESTITLKEDLEINYIAPINHVINISMGQLDKNYNYSDNLNTEQLNIEIEKKIQSLKDSEMVSSDFNTLSSHDIHQYTLLYGILVAAAILGAIVLYRRVRCSSRAETEAPPLPESAAGQVAARPRTPPVPPPARSTSMSHLSDVSISDSARVRKFNSDTELKVLKPVSVPKRLVFSESEE